MLGIAQRLLRSFRSEGLLGMTRRAQYHSYELYREWSLGIKTTLRMDPYGPTGDQQHRPYEPLCYACIDTGFSRLSPTSHDVLLDYGCGRGRVTSIAATYPFGRVIGVELNRQLCAAARINMERVRGRRCSDWEILEIDATQFIVPTSVNVVFLFNPFLGEVLDCVVHRLEDSLAESPRALNLIYMNPESDRDVFEECSWLYLKEELPVGLWRGMRFRLYEAPVP